MSSPIFASFNSVEKVLKIYLINMKKKKKKKTLIDYDWIYK